MTKQSSLTLLVALVALTITEGQDLKGRCGDCWCIAGTDGTCPTNTTGITDSFTEEDGVYLTFVLSNPDAAFLKLQTADGVSPCYPFADTLGAPIDGYPLSSEPQCAFPVSTDTSVCAYVYDPSATSCEGRSYEIATYSDEAEAEAAGAIILHQGACGVCSTAQDFGVRIQTYGELESQTVVCATSYVFSQDFDALVSCISEIGFTQECATLWAHFSATNGALCATDCLPDSETGLTLLQGDPPECEPQGCLICQEAFRADFEAISGIMLHKAGITERIARDCDSFYRVTHDPCVGIGSAGPGTQAPVEPTDAPVGSGTQAPVEPTDAPVGVPTDAPVEPTDAPVGSGTQAPLEPTDAPVAAPSSAISNFSVTSTLIAVGSLMASLGFIAFHI